MTYEHYFPFGDKVNNPTDTKNDQWYNGKRYDLDIFLSYYGARYYDPAIGRFYSNDPIGFTGGMDTFNRYSYVGNNPFKYIDPTGMKAECGEIGYAGSCGSSGSNKGERSNDKAAMDVLTNFFSSTQETADSAVETVPAGIRNDPTGTLLDLSAIGAGTLSLYTGVGIAPGSLAIVLGLDGLQAKIKGTQSVIESEMTTILSKSGVTRPEAVAKIMHTGLGLAAGGLKGINGVLKGKGDAMDALGAVSDTKNILDRVSGN